MDVIQLLKDTAPAIAAIASVAAAVIGVWGSGSVARKNLKMDLEIHDWCVAKKKDEQRRQIEAVIGGTIEQLHNKWRSRKLLYYSVAFLVESIAMLAFSLTPGVNAVSFFILSVMSVITLVASLVAAYRMLQIRQGRTTAGTAVYSGGLSHECVPAKNVGKTASVRREEAMSCEYCRGEKLEVFLGGHIVRVAVHWFLRWSGVRS